MKTVRCLLLSFVLISSLNGCATSGNYCDLYNPTYLTNKEVDSLTDLTLSKIKTDNDTWSRVCK